MELRSLIAAAALAAFAALPGCGGNSDEDCRTVCEWWHQYCFGETVESCVADCKDTDESAKEAITRCVQGQGWGTPSSCVSASCCVRWVYSADSYASYCLGQ